MLSFHTTPQSLGIGLCGPRFISLCKSIALCLNIFFAEVARK